VIANVSAHRRAHAFAQALEEQIAQGRTAEQPGASAQDAERRRLLTLAGGLGELPKPEMDPEVKTVQRAQLVAAMEAMLAGGHGAPVPRQRSGRGTHRARPLHRLRPRSRWSRGLAAGGLTVGVAASALGGVAAASSDALPGDSLYGLKRGMEDLKRGMADDGADRGRIYLDQAATRMQEARRLMERGRGGPLDHATVSDVRRALSGMRHDASEGYRLLHEAYRRDGSLAPIRALESFSSTHRGTWSDLRDRLPAQLNDVSEQVTSVFDAIDREVGPLSSMLPDAPGSGRSPGGSDNTVPRGPGDPANPLPSFSGPSSGQNDGKPQPSTSDEDQGLIGDAGDLLTSPGTGDSSASPSGGDTTDATSEPDLTIPPLLPNLLPDLGLGSDAG
jgi:hypothetical protein